MSKNLQKRFWEIDFLRGVAIVMMIIFHIVFDMTFFGVRDFAVNGIYWRVFARLTAIIFLLLVGISLTLSYSRFLKIKQTKPQFKKYLKRGGTVFIYGILITIFTLFLIGEAYVRFGILHLIGISIIFAYPFLKYKYFNFVLGILIISLGIILRNYAFDFDWLLWLGFIPKNLYTVDYFPLFPWFGVVLIGVFLGNMLYPGYNSLIVLPDYSKNIFFRSFSFLGKNSLLIYLIHQPIIVLGLFVLGFA